MRAAQVNANFRYTGWLKEVEATNDHSIELATLLLLGRSAGFLVCVPNTQL